MNNSHLIQVKYLGPTNTRGSRVQLKTYDLTHRNNGKPAKITLSYNYSCNGASHQAEKIMQAAGLEIIGCNSRNPDHDVYMLKWDFDSLCALFNVKIEQ